MSKHYNIPVFVPHYGCPFSCVFCNQNEICGRDSETDLAEAEKIIDAHLKLLDGKDVEIAFFGGSFTAIPQEIMTAYLKLAGKYIDSGRVRGIRLSTRPDFIDSSVLDILKEAHVTTIELGAQSFDDEVLRKSGRGHLAADTIEACRLIKSYGCFELGIQLMTGLPGDTSEKSVRSAEIAAGLEPSQARIYPTLVIRGTAMEKMFENGTYTPQTLENAVGTVSRMLDIFDENNVRVIRVGLSSIEEMQNRGAIVAGPVHPAFRELCDGERYRAKLEAFVSAQHTIPRCVTAFAPKSEISKLIGHKRCNAEMLQKKYGIKLKTEEAEEFSLKAE